MKTTTIESIKVLSRPTQVMIVRYRIRGPWYCQRTYDPTYLSLRRLEHMLQVRRSIVTLYDAPTWWFTT